MVPTLESLRVKILLSRSLSNLYKLLPIVATMLAVILRQELRPRRKTPRLIIVGNDQRVFSLDWEDKSE